MRKFNREDRGLHLLEAEIPSDDTMVITQFHPVLAEYAHFRRQFIIAANDHSRITGGSPIFRRIKTERTGLTPRARLRNFSAKSIFCANRLRCIFDHMELIAL